MRYDSSSTKNRIKVNFNEIDPLLNFTLGKVNQSQAIDPIAEHIHPDSFEIVSIVKGEQIYYVGDNNYTVKSGECFMTLPNELHSTGGYPEDKSTLYYLILPQATLSLIGFNETECNYILTYLSTPTQRVFPGDPTLYKLLEQLIQSPIATHPLPKTRICSLLTQFLLALIDCMSNKQTPSSHIFTTVLDYIDTHIYDTISIKDLCYLTHLSESHFKSHFRSIIGLPPAEYILRQKIQHSKTLLLSSSKTITEIAFILSFSSSQYFATVFKRFTTLTPAEYRLKHKDKD